MSKIRLVCRKDRRDLRLGNLNRRGVQRGGNRLNRSIDLLREQRLKGADLVVVNGYVVDSNNVLKIVKVGGTDRRSPPYLPQIIKRLRVGQSAVGKRDNRLVRLVVDG